MNKVTWGVLSVSKFAMEKAIPAMQRSEWCRIEAIAFTCVRRASFCPRRAPRRFSAHMNATSSASSRSSS